MPRATLLCAMLLLSLAACEPVTSTNVTVSGDAVVGVSYGDTAPYYSRGLAGPPPGRTQAEQAARKEYYRGPRGNEF